MSLSPTDMAAELHALYGAGKMFTENLSGVLTLDEAYEAQFALLQHRQNDGEKLAGWKVGLTSQAMQIQQGVHEPCLGHLLVSGHRGSSARFEFDEMMSPGIENELCLEIGNRLEGKNVSFEEAAASISAIAPALEVVEKRSVFGADFPLAIAGNAQQLAYVTGAFVPVTQEVDLSTIEVSVEINGKTAEQATGAEVLGNPVNSLIWLAGFLSDHNLAIEPGSRIMSGSFTKQYAVSKADNIRSYFTQFGEVVAEFV